MLLVLTSPLLFIWALSCFLAKSSWRFVNFAYLLKVPALARYRFFSSAYGIFSHPQEPSGGSARCSSIGLPEDKHWVSTHSRPCPGSHQKVEGNLERKTFSFARVNPGFLTQPIFNILSSPTYTHRQKKISVLWAVPNQQGQFCACGSLPLENLSCPPQLS